MTPPYGRKWRRTKEPFDESEREWKIWLKLNIQKRKIIASGPITSWEIHREKGETVKGFILRGSKITEDGDCSHENKRCLLLGGKVMTNLDSILKSRDITLLKKALSSQSNGFSSSHVWMWKLGCKENWAPKNDVFKLWCWRRLLKVPWIARRSNQLILKEINPEYSLKGLLLKLQCFDYLMWRTDSLERPWCLERLEAGGEGDDRGWDGCEFEQVLGVGDGQGSLACCSLWGHKELDTTEQLNWTDSSLCYKVGPCCLSIFM